MQTQEAEEMALRYPIGKADVSKDITDADLESYISTIAELPVKVKAVTAGLSEEQLDTPYRPGGWTVRQVAHHLADSHMNAYMRFKLALTEDTPSIKPYAEKLWAELPDSQGAIDTSLLLLDGLHARWAILLRSMSVEDMDKRYHHPQRDSYHTLRQATGLYAWHSKHHLAHISKLKERMGW